MWYNVEGPRASEPWPLQVVATKTTSGMLENADLKRDVRLFGSRQAMERYFDDGFCPSIDLIFAHDKAFPILQADSFYGPASVGMTRSSIISRPRRYSVGLTPVAFRNATGNALVSLNPTEIAVSVIGRAGSANKNLAGSIRRLMRSRCGGVPNDCLNTRQKMKGAQPDELRKLGEVSRNSSASSQGRLVRAPI